MNKITICFVITLMTLCSCQKENISLLLCGDGYRYWYENGKDKSKVLIHYFDKDGQWLLFEGHTMGFNHTGYDMSLLERGEWNLSKENNIEISHKKYTVICMEPSLIVLQKEDEKAQHSLSPMKEEDIPDNYKMLWK